MALHFCVQVTVIEETIRYIDQLHEALAERVESETGQSVFYIQL